MRIFFLQANAQSQDISRLMQIGSVGMLILAIGIITFVIMHQRRVFRYNERMKKMEAEKQQIMLMASIRFQEEERQRIAADLHDDAGPLLATARLYLSENMLNLDRQTQLQNIYNARQIIDDTIMLVRNISHSLMPPTLKNFGLESAVSDMFQKLSATGKVNASARFHDYRTRLRADQELVIFRIIQELVANILKHSNSAFIHLTQNATGDKMYLRLHHDGKGLVQSEFERLNQVASGLGLKNIASRIKVLNGRIHFEIDQSHTYYKVTLEVPKHNEMELAEII